MGSDPSSAHHRMTRCSALRYWMCWAATAMAGLFTLLVACAWIRSYVQAESIDWGGGQQSQTSEDERSIVHHWWHLSLVSANGDLRLEWERTFYASISSYIEVGRAHGLGWNRLTSGETKDYWTAPDRSGSPRRGIDINLQVCGFALVARHFEQPGLFANGGLHLTTPYAAWCIVGIVMTTLLWRRAIHLRTGRPGHCPQCGYDLRATPEQCHECGRIR